MASMLVYDGTVMICVYTSPSFYIFLPMAASYLAGLSNAKSSVELSMIAA